LLGLDPFLVIAVFRGASGDGLEKGSHDGEAGERRQGAQKNGQGS
jgi:hypothetical protein